jgi:hypothetical protein
MGPVQTALVWRKSTPQPPCPEAEAKIEAVVKFETPACSRMGSVKSVTILVSADSES